MAEVKQRRIQFTEDEENLISEEVRNTGISEQELVRRIVYEGVKNYFGPSGNEMVNKVGEMEKELRHTTALCYALLGNMAYMQHGLFRSLYSLFGQWEVEGFNPNANYIAANGALANFELWEGVGEELAANGGDLMNAIQRFFKDNDYDTGAIFAPGVLDRFPDATKRRRTERAAGSEAFAKTLPDPATGKGVWNG